MQAAHHFLEGHRDKTSRSISILTRIHASVDIVTVLLIVTGTISIHSQFLLLGIPLLLWLVQLSYRPTKKELFILTILNRMVMFSNLVVIAGTFEACIEYTTSWYHIGRYLTMTTLAGMNFMCGLFTDEDFRSLTIYDRLEQEFPVSIHLFRHMSALKTAAVA